MAKETTIARESRVNTQNATRNANGRRVLAVPRNLSQATNARERELEERFNYLSSSYGVNRDGNLNYRNLRRINRALRNIAQREGLFRNVAI